MNFKLVSDYKPQGDQPEAIDALVRGLEDGEKHQVLLGITGSGKTFSVASVVAHVNRPTLVMAHNKTLAAQLYQEFKSFFPENAVEYFVSYYDYYQPEAYVAATDTYIEKEATINDEIDRLRLSATPTPITECCSFSNRGSASSATRSSKSWSSCFTSATTPSSVAGRSACAAT